MYYYEKIYSNSTFKELLIFYLFLSFVKIILTLSFTLCVAGLIFELTSFTGVGLFLDFESTGSTAF